MGHKSSTLLFQIVIPILCTFTQSVDAAAQTLEAELQRTSAADWATLAREHGDAARGAIVFFQPALACSKCHAVGDGKPLALGPDLAALGREVGDEVLVESVLLPSKLIRKGYEPIIVATTDGRVLNGLMVE